MKSYIIKVLCCSILAVTLHAQDDLEHLLQNKTLYKKNTPVDKISNTPRKNKISISGALGSTLLGICEGILCPFFFFIRAGNSNEQAQLAKEEHLKKSLQHYSARLAYVLQKKPISKFPTLKSLYNSLDQVTLNPPLDQTSILNRWVDRLFKETEKEKQSIIPIVMTNNQEALGTTLRKLFIAQEIDDYATAKKKQWEIAKNVIAHSSNKLIERLRPEHKQDLDQQITKLGVKQNLYKALYQCQTALARDCKPQAIHTVQTMTDLQKGMRRVGACVPIIACVFAMAARNNQA